MSIHPSSEFTHVFPFGSTRTIYPYDHVLNEKNIANMIKTVVDLDNYLISYDSSTKLAKFVIKGYYFECIVPSVGGSYANLWASIELVASGDNLFGEDNDGEFTGLSFTNTDPDSTEYSLKITNSSGVPEPTSFLKINGSSVCISGTKSLLDEIGISEEDEDKTKSLRELLDDVKTAIATEVGAREDGDDELSRLLQAEAQEREDQDDLLSQSIASEAGLRETQDNALSGRIDAEVLARQGGDNALSGEIAAEAGTRAAQDTLLSGRIDAEIIARGMQDTALSSSIASESSARVAAVAEIKTILTWKSLS